MNNQELHDKFVQYGQNAKEWIRKCIILLPEIYKRKIWEQKGFGSIYEYAAKLAGMSHDTVNETLRIMKKVADKPELKKVIEEKGIWAVRPAVNVATSETDRFWAEKARKMPQSTLTTYIKEFRNNEDAHRVNTAIPKTEKPRKIILPLDLTPSLACELEKIKTENWDETIKELLKLRYENLQFIKPESVKTKSRPIPGNIQKYLTKRSNCKCEFPLCKKDYHSFHHADRFSLVHEHNPDRIFALCKEHHEIAHRSLIDNEQHDIRFWKARETADRSDFFRHMIDQKVILQKNS